MNDSINKLITFHNNPTFDVFIDIIESDNVKKKLDGMLEVWTNAALRAYGEKWAQTYEDDLLEEDNLQSIEKKMFRLTNLLRKNLNFTPKLSDIKKMWYIFFANGDYELLTELYICLGNTNTKQSIRNEAAELYKTHQEIYAEMLNDDENPFVQLTNDVNKQIKKINDAKQDYEEKIKSLTTSVTDVERDVEYLNKKIVEKEEVEDSKKEKQEKLDSLFDDISNKI